MVELIVLVRANGKRGQPVRVSGALASVISLLLLIALVANEPDEPLLAVVILALATLSAVAAGRHSRNWLLAHAGTTLAAVPILLVVHPAPPFVPIALITLTLIGGWFAGRDLVLRPGFRTLLAGGVISSLALVAAQSLSREALFVVAPAQKLNFQGWTVSLRDVVPAVGPGWSGLAADVSVKRGGDIATLHPERQTRLHPERTRAPETILSRWDGDLSIRLGEPRGDGSWALSLAWRPFGSLVKLGALIALLGALAMLLRDPLQLRWRARRIARSGKWWA